MPFYSGALVHPEFVWDVVFVWPFSSKHFFHWLQLPKFIVYREYNMLCDNSLGCVDDVGCLHVVCVLVHHTPVHIRSTYVLACKDN